MARNDRLMNAHDSTIEPLSASVDDPIIVEATYAARRCAVRAALRCTRTGEALWRNVSICNLKAAVILVLWRPRFCAHQRYSRCFVAMTTGDVTVPIGHVT